MCIVIAVNIVVAENATDNPLVNAALQKGLSQATGIDIFNIYVARSTDHSICSVNITTGLLENAPTIMPSRRPTTRPTKRNHDGSGEPQRRLLSEDTFDKESPSSRSSLRVGSIAAEDDRKLLVQDENGYTTLYMSIVATVPGNNSKEPNIAVLFFKINSLKLYYLPLVLRTGCC